MPDGALTFADGVGLDNAAGAVGEPGRARRPADPAGGEEQLRLLEKQRHDVSTRSPFS